MSLARSLLIVFCAAFPALTPAKADDASAMQRMRADFLAAEQALRQGDEAAFEKAFAALAGYPLQPYLTAQSLERRLKTVDPARLAAFLAEHAGTPYGDRLQRRWLHTLARQGRWEVLAAHSPAPAPDTELECHRRTALRLTGREDEAFHELQSLWLSPRSLPAACDPLFDAWRARDGISPEFAWQRFRLAMGANQVTLARYLVRFLDEKRTGSANAWLRLHARPELLERENAPDDSTEKQELYAHAFSRLLTRDTERALLVWEQLPASASPAVGGLRSDLEARLATMLALRRHPAAQQRLEALDDAHADDTAREWRIRAALQAEDWRAVAEGIARLPEAEQGEIRWRYWLARSLDATGDHEGARAVWLEIAGVRDYYGFLAADRIGLPYRFGHASMPIDETALAALAAAPGMMRAHELHLLGRLPEARREWHYATRALDGAGLQTAAYLAHRWGWHDRAILAVARTPERDDLELRFPLAFRGDIVAAAAAQGIDPALGFAIIRQESAFAADARSSAGALGLMQLMPATARRVAAQLDVSIGNSTRLLDVALNLRLGMSYLRRLIERFGHQASALAAYNAGPHRATAWLPRDRNMDADLWAETIPFRETRNYVQNVMYFSAIYEDRLDLPRGGLAARMKEAITPPGTRLTHTGSPAPDA